MLGTKHLPFLLCISIGLISTYCVYQSMNHFSYALIPDSLFSEQVIHDLSYYIAEHADESPDQLSMNLLQNFSIIKQITARRRSDGLCDLVVTSIKPIAFVSSTMIVCDDGKCVSSEHFIASSLQNLNTFKCDHQLSVQEAQELIAFIKKYPADCFKKYAVAWQNKNEIFFHRHNEPIIFLASEDMIPNDSLYQTVHELSVEIDGIGTIPNKKQKTLIADIRFERQLILYENKGARHGNNSIF